MGNHYIGEKLVTEEEWKYRLDMICNPIMQGDINPLIIASELMKRFNEQMELLDEITK